MTLRRNLVYIMTQIDRKKTTEG